MENRHAERLTRDVLLTLSSGSNLFYDPFLEFPCVALALVHFSTFIITLLLLFLFFFPLFLLQLLRFVILLGVHRRIEKSKLWKSPSRNRIRVQWNVKRFFDVEIAASFTANFVDFFFFFSLTSICQSFTRMIVVLLPETCQVSLSVYLNCNDLGLPRLWACLHTP